MLLFLSWLYVLALGGIALLGLHLGLLLLVAIRARGQRSPQAPGPRAVWPSVLVQLPLYNERYVVERLIDAACALDYPALTLQVLDDSTDDTVTLAKARVAHYRARGVDIHYLHRAQRADFKAGALAAGLQRARADFIAIFDADFVPPPDFLRRALADFTDPSVGLVQARWEHLNPEANWLTRTQALGADGYFMTDQLARSAAGLLMNFNGSAGVWRRACIEDAGGWQGDTLAEDLDLSYRAQLKGWRLTYRPDLAVPAELPPTMAALKNQQFRWAKGSFQVLRKLGGQLFAAPMPLWRKVLGFLHLAGFGIQPLALAVLLLSLPVILHRGQLPVNLSWLGILAVVPVAVETWGQLALGRVPPRRLLAYPLLFLISLGLSLTNTRALWEAFFSGEHDFKRTPKGYGNIGYALTLDWTTWGELCLALYACATGLLALELAPSLAPLIFLYALGFGYTAGLGLWESGFGREQVKKWQVMSEK